jgi:hypothetical protein
MQLKVMPTMQQVEKVMTENFIFTMASGQVGDELKFYFHSQFAERDGYVFSELIFKQGTGYLTGTIKTTKGDQASRVTKKYESALSSFTF